MTLPNVFFVLLAICVGLTSCSDRNLSDDLVSRLDDENFVYDCKAFIDVIDQDIEVQGERFESLSFSNEQEECKSVLWYINDTLQVVREINRRILTNEQLERSFYFKDGKLYLIQEIKDVPKDGVIESTELIIFYDSETPARAWSNFSLDGVFDPSKYVESIPVTHSPERALEMFRCENSFALNFEDFLETSGERYLLVSTSHQQKYIAAIKINQMDDFLNELFRDRIKLKNAPITIQHQIVNQGGWIFHYYVKGELR
jgi:hypothetical protein